LSERSLCCASGGREPDEVHSICTPSKVSRPMLPAWMKDAHLLPRLGITGMSMPPFVAITGAATRAYIGSLSLTTRLFWDGVIDLQRHAEQCFWAMAVGAAKLRKLCPQRSAQGERNRTHPLFPFTLRVFVRWSRRNRALALFSETC
jgi:hypothetical protein